MNIFNTFNKFKKNIAITILLSATFGATWQASAFLGLNSIFGLRSGTNKSKPTLIKKTNYHKVNIKKSGILKLKTLKKINVYLRTGIITAISVTGLIGVLGLLYLTKNSQNSQKSQNTSTQDHLTEQKKDPLILKMEEFDKIMENNKPSEDSYSKLLKNFDDQLSLCEEKIKKIPTNDENFKQKIKDIEEIKEKIINNKTMLSFQHTAFTILNNF